MNSNMLPWIVSEIELLLLTTNFVNVWILWHYISMYSCNAPCLVSTILHLHDPATISNDCVLATLPMQHSIWHSASSYKYDDIDGSHLYFVCGVHVAIDSIKYLYSTVENKTFFFHESSFSLFVLRLP